MATWSARKGARASSTSAATSGSSGNRFVDIEQAPSDARRAWPVFEREIHPPQVAIVARLHYEGAAPGLERFRRHFVGVRGEEDVDPRLDDVGESPIAMQAQLAQNDHDLGAPYPQLPERWHRGASRYAPSPSRKSKPHAKGLAMRGTISEVRPMKPTRTPPVSSTSVPGRSSSPADVGGIVCARLAARLGKFGRSTSPSKSSQSRARASQAGFRLVAQAGRHERRRRSPSCPGTPTSMPSALTAGTIALPRV